MSKDKNQKTATEIDDAELDSVSAGATWGQGSVGPLKESLLIQTDVFPSDTKLPSLGGKGDVLLNPSRTYKGK